ncbi:MAG TPA: ribulose-phosphate 3-epimerase [Candidatus Faecousia excrementipullorum]|nr:ribulose-phosphate 3-epimerase [Candidatus Faecousia excrementipullorum]
MAILSPSLLAADPLNLGKEMKRAEAAGAQWLHVDVMDGCFVPNLSSFTYSTVAAMRKATSLTLDVHLMIEKPIRYVEDFCRAGADYLTIHVEADSRENIRAALEKIRGLGVRPGIVLKPGTPAEAAEEFLPLVDMVLVMTVEPGFGGQKFMASMMPKVTRLRQLLDKVNPSCHVEVDGGVDKGTCRTCMESGADVLVAGSAFFRSEDPEALRILIEG